MARSFIYEAVAPEQPSYSHVWFNPKAFSCLEKFANKSNINFLEIGCFEGYGTNYFIDNFLDGTNSTITCVDPWIKYSESTVTGMSEWDDVINQETFNVFRRNTDQNSAKITIRRGLSKDILPSLNGFFHFILIDGDHSEEAVWLDAIMSFRLLHSGGIMIFDDYDWNIGKMSPKLAIDRFVEEYKDVIYHKQIGNQIIVEKIAANLQE